METMWCGTATRAGDLVRERAGGHEGASARDRRRVRAGGAPRDGGVEPAACTSTPTRKRRSTCSTARSSSTSTARSGRATPGTFVLAPRGVAAHVPGPDRDCPGARDQLVAGAAVTGGFELPRRAGGHAGDRAGAPRAGGARPGRAHHDRGRVRHRDPAAGAAVTAGRACCVVVAHPDDETFGCGSVLAHAAARGRRDRGRVRDPRASSASPRPGRASSGRSSVPCAKASCAPPPPSSASAAVVLLGWRDSGVDGEPATGSLAAADVDDVAAAVAA